MAVTPEDLLVDAQLAALRSARELPAVRAARQGFTPRGEGRGQAALAAYVSHRTAWPRLAAAGRHALDCVPMSPRVRRDFEPLMTTLRRIERRSFSRGGEAVTVASPQLLRTAELVGAAGDAMKERVHFDGVSGGELDRQTRAAGRQVAAPLLTVARLTLSYLEQSPASQASPLWRELHEQLHHLTSTATVREPSIVTSRLVPDTLDPSLASALGTWRRQLDRHLETGADITSVTTGVDLLRGAHAIAYVHAAAAAVARRDDRGPDPEPRAGHTAHREAAQAWLRASRTWSDQMMVPGQRRAESDAAHEALISALAAHVTALRRDDVGAADLEGTFRDTVQDSAALTRFVRAELPVVAADHARLVDGVLGGGGILVRARLLREAMIRDHLDPLDLDGRPDSLEGRAWAVRRDADLTGAVRRGGWVVLPRYAEPAFQVRAQVAQAITATAFASAVAAGAGRTPAAAAGLPSVDVEALAARAASAAGFPTGVRHRPVPARRDTSPVVEPGRPPSHQRSR